MYVSERERSGANRRRGRCDRRTGSRLSLVGQWQELEAGLGPGWGEARLRLTVESPPELGRVTSLLGPAQPLRSEPDSVSFRVARDGSGPSSEAARRLLGRLDTERLHGSLVVVSSSAAPAVETAAPAARLAESWTAALATLPGDWSDLLGEIELWSSDYLERAALHLGPVNPRRIGAGSVLQFRSARRFGYGASRSTGTTFTSCSAATTKPSAAAGWSSKAATAISRCRRSRQRVRRPAADAEGRPRRRHAEVDVERPGRAARSPAGEGGTAILTLQNGLGNEERLAELFGHGACSGGMAFACINRVAPGVIRHTDHGSSASARSPAAQPQPAPGAIAAMFTTSRIRCEVGRRPARGRWKKLTWNIPFNGLGAAIDLTTDRLIGSETGRRLVAELIREVIAAARADGVELPESLVETQITNTPRWAPTVQHAGGPAGGPADGGRGDPRRAAAAGEGAAACDAGPGSAVPAAGWCDAARRGEALAAGNIRSCA